MSGIEVTGLHCTCQTLEGMNSSGNCSLLTQSHGWLETASAIKQSYDCVQGLLTLLGMGLDGQGLLTLLGMTLLGMGLWIR